MPCGGIYPCAPSKYPCFYCSKSSPAPDHTLIEWDSVLHAACVAPFLETDEGKLVLEHKHLIAVSFDGEVPAIFAKEGK